MSHVVHGSAGVQQKQNPQVGDRVTYRTSTGYKQLNQRPASCYYGKCVCEAGNCNGVSTEHTETIARVIGFMDNSTEVYTESGKMLMWEYPHGDVCY